MNNQGKRQDQIKFSNLMVLIGFIGLAFCTGWALIYFNNSTNNDIGPADKYWFPYQDSTMYVDSLMNRDTLDMHSGIDDSIPSYDTFIDVPAGGSDIIMVNGVLHKINDDKTQWMPIYEDIDMDCGGSDEYRRWIGDNGDTIWE